MPPLSRWIASLAALALLGCGGSASVENAARFRFFNGFTDTGDVRVYVGDHLYSSGGDASIANGNKAAYDEVPSGSNAITVSPYAGSGTSYATLSARNLLEGQRYTVVGLTQNSKRSLLFIEDELNTDDTGSQLRVVNASSAYDDLVVTLRRKENDSETAFFNYVESGGDTGYQYVDLADDSTDEFKLNVYRTNSNGGTGSSVSDEGTITLRPGSAHTVFLYDSTTGSSRVKLRTATDVEGD